MDVFLIRDGLILNAVKVESVEQAELLYCAQDEGVIAIERTPENQHLNIGETHP